MLQAALVLLSSLVALVLVLSRRAWAPEWLSARKGLPTLYYSSTPYKLRVRGRRKPGVGAC